MMENKNIVSVIVFDRVKAGYETEFKSWQIRITSELQKFTGFIGISPKKLDGSDNEYLTVFQFDSSENLQQWMDSETLDNYLNEARQFMVAEPKVSFYHGLEIFFDKTPLIQPPFYKKVIVGILAVYPLILLVGKLYHWLIPGFDQLPFEAALFFEVILISSLMTWPVMPTITKWFHSWLSQ